MVTTSFCILCGEALQYRSSFGRGKNYPICKKPVCLESYLTMRAEAHVLIVSKKVDPDAYYTNRRKERHGSYCNRCGKPMWIDFRNSYFRHLLVSTCENAPTIRKPRKTAGLKTRRKGVLHKHKVELKPKPRIYLKPWQDPDSLYCDTEFLETEILHKKIRTGEECKSTIKP